MAMSINLITTVIVYLVIVLPFITVGGRQEELQAIQAPGQDLVSVASDVTTANGFRSGVKASAGKSMDTLKIVENPPGGYLGIYHSSINSVFYVRLAVSNDL